MSGVERPLGSGELGQDLGPRARLARSLRRIPALARREYAARFGPVESVLLGILIVSPLAIAWHFAAPYYFLSDDLIDFYRADHVGALSYLFEPGLVRGHLSPLSRFAYLALGRVAPMNFDVALASLLAFHAVSAVLLQRILTLLFGRAWWTYALALAWPISIAVYLPAIAWFAAGVHSITAITATLASIHGYLCWRTTGRRVWIIWSVAAMCIGLGFYEKAIRIPFYLFLMRVLLLDPAAGLLDSLRSLQDEWRVWLAYATVCALYLVVYFLGGYSQLSGGFTGGEILGFLGAFWAEGFWPTMFGVRDLERQGDWHWIVIVATQVALFVLLVWSVVRRGTAWRPWAFLLVVLVANALLVVEKLAWIGQGPAITSHVVRYYTEPALLVALTIPFVFAAPRLRARVAPVEPVAPPEPVPTVEAGVPTTERACWHRGASGAGGLWSRDVDECAQPAVRPAGAQERASRTRLLRHPPRRPRRRTPRRSGSLFDRSRRA